MRMTNELKFFKGFFLNENQEFLLKKFSKNLFFYNNYEEKKTIELIKFHKKNKNNKDLLYKCYENNNKSNKEFSIDDKLEKILKNIY